MTGETQSPRTIDEYITDFSTEVQQILQNIRAIVHEEAPQAQETIKYHMPTFTLGGNLVFFAAFKKHIGFYPPVAGDAALKKELAPYEGPKDSLIFPFNQPMPYELIRRIVKVRLQENLAKAKK